MNKHQAKKEVERLKSELEFLKRESEKEIKHLKDDLTLYKNWFKASQKDNKKLSAENLSLWQENNKLKGN